MAMDAHEIERLIKQGIPDAKVSIRDLAGDGDHYAAEVVSASFGGETHVHSTRWSTRPCRATWAASSTLSPSRPARRKPMSIGDLVKGVVSDVLNDMLKKATGTTKRRRRRRAATPTERLRQIEKLLKPAKRQTSRKKTVRTRSKAKRRA